MKPTAVLTFVIALLGSASAVALVAINTCCDSRTEFLGAGMTREIVDGRVFYRYADQYVICSWTEGMPAACVDL